MRQNGISGLTTRACIMAVRAGAAVVVTAGIGLAAVPGPVAHAATAPPRKGLVSVSCVSAADCLAVGMAGATGQALVERWGGARWTASKVPLPPGAYSSPLSGVSCPSATACVAVGTYTKSDTGRSIPFADRWNGKKWLVNALPAPKGASSVSVNAVACATATRCVLVGSYFAGNNSPSLAEVWNGSTWKLTAPGGGGLQGVTCTSATRCFAVGATENGLPVIESWNGVKWTAAKAPVPGKAAYGVLFGVSCLSVTTCTAVGGYYYPSTGQGGALAERWNGKTWALVLPPTPKFTTGGSLTDLRSVSCTSPKFCIATGSYGGGGYLLGTAFSEMWNGTKWKIVPVPAAPVTGNDWGSILTSVRCLSTKDCVAVGQYAPFNGGGWAYSAHWAGKSWKLIPA
jgi:hypothetical protein